MAFIDRISTLDPAYTVGQLSIYPVAQDNENTLYQVSNNASTVLTQGLNYNQSYIVVADTSAFPPMGLLAIGTEIIYYDQKVTNQFQNLKRGFAGSRQDQWPKGTSVGNAVMAEPHNATKDALLNVEANLGTAVNPTVLSLNGILKGLETRFLAPRPLFRGLPVIGPSPFTVQFQNFSQGDVIRYFWDFGDGGTSLEKAPSHTYLTEGTFTVSLNIITSSLAQGIVTKSNYITVDNNHRPAFFYVVPQVGTTSTVFSFVDQTDGDITSRYWVWGDGTNTSITDPNNHTATHTYSVVGTYNPSLLVIFADDTKEVVRIEEPIIVS